MPTTHHAICPLCEASCGILVDVDDGRATAIRGDADDALSHGHVCPKVMGLLDIQDDPDRLRQPMRRVGAGWEPATWDEALDDIAQRIHALQQANGRSAMGVYMGNPNVHNVGSMLHGPRFLRSLRTKNRFSATSVDQLPHMLASLQQYGHQLLIGIPDIDRTDLLVVIGANPMVSNGSLMTSPDMRGRLRALRQRGGSLVVIDPRRTETARVADEHVAIRPGTDAVWLLAVIHVILAERGADLGHLADEAEGLQAIEALAARFPPERVERVTGIPAATTRRLALALADTDRAALYGRIGTCVQEHGGHAAWLLNVVNAVAGNLDRHGGILFPQPAIDPIDLPAGLGASRGHMGRWHTTVRGLPEFGGELPASTMAEEIEAGAIRGMLIIAGNPVLSTPNGPRLDHALEGLELLVSIDLTLNESARHAHWVLPVAPPLSRPHYDLVFHLFAVRNTTRYAAPVLPLEAGLRHDWQVFLELKRRLEKARGTRKLADRLTEAVLRRAGIEPVLDLLLRTGRHGGLTGLSLRRLRREPSGIDLGPLRPCLLDRMPITHGPIQLAPPLYLEDVDRLDALADGPVPDLVLIGRRQLRSNNSWMHNSARLNRGRDRCTLLVHPRDATAAGLATGDRARVSSAVGAIEAPVEVSDEIMAGVVSLPHGWGHDKPGTRFTVASARPGVSVNDLTDDQRVDPLSGNAVLNGVPVELTAAVGERR